MDSGHVAVNQKNGGLLSWLMKILSFPCSFYKLIFDKEIRNSLPNKVVLITGASSGLGEALAHVFYSTGCKLILSSRRVEELERVKNDLLQIEAIGLTHAPMILPLDLTDINSLPGKVNQVLAAYGHIDILVNNGGVSIRSNVVDTNVDVDIKIMLTNYFGTIALTKAVLPSMIARKEGRILCIGSVQGKFAIPQRASYSASKHALQAFCDSLRAEVDEHNVKVTLISPGYISTNFSVNALTGTGNAYAKMDESTAHGADPIEMAKYILQAVLKDKKDVIICGLAPRLAYYIRYLIPALYFKIMSLRAQKLSKQNHLKKDD